LIDHTFSGTGTGQAKWRPALASGTYDVYAWWPSQYSVSTGIPYTIVSTSGNQTVLVNQADSTTWGKWNKLGTYTLDAATAADRRTRRTPRPTRSASWRPARRCRLHRRSRRSL